MKGPLAINFEKLWQVGMHDWHGKMPERMIDDSLEEAFWAQSFEKKTLKQTDAYATTIFNEMKQHLDVTDSVIEIGPGWGNYTFPLSEMVQHVTCVDSSISVLNYLQTCLQNQSNLSYVQGKWEEVSNSITQHDIVLGVNCFYRMYHMLDSLKSMNRLAKKKAIIGLTTGPIQPHYELLSEKYGYDIKYPRRDYIEIVNMLYQLGIYADCKMIPLMREYVYDSEEDLVKAQSKKILDTNFKTSHLLDSLSPFTKETSRGIVYEHEFYASIISWNPKPQI